LKTTVNVIFIANEEAGAIQGIGIDQLAREGYLEQLKGGPVFWVDAADRQPCVGTAGMVQWKLKTNGKLFHSGLPHKGINSIEMAMDAVNYIQERFYADFPPHALEEQYAFMTCSTMKPTHISSSEGSLNQLPPLCTVSGDIRLSPFYKIAEAMASIDGYIADINADPSGVLEKNLHGPHSKYSIPEESVKGNCEMVWLNEGEDGIACDMSSISFHALSEATAAVLGASVHYSIGGSLPLVGTMQAQGFDIQIVGYGKSSAYHAANEFADLQHFREASQIFSKVISIMEEKCVA
jgi:acetylornithine deacetylase